MVLVALHNVRGDVLTMATPSLFTCLWKSHRYGSLWLYIMLAKQKPGVPEGVVRVQVCIHRGTGNSICSKYDYRTSLFWLLLTF